MLRNSHTTRQAFHKPPFSSGIKRLADENSSLRPYLTRVNQCHVLKSRVPVYTTALCLSISREDASGFLLLALINRISSLTKSFSALKAQKLISNSLKGLLTTPGPGHLTDYSRLADDSTEYAMNSRTSYQRTSSFSSILPHALNESRRRIKNTTVGAFNSLRQLTAESS